MLILIRVEVWELQYPPNKGGINIENPLIEEEGEGDFSQEMNENKLEKKEEVENKTSEQTTTMKEEPDSTTTIEKKVIQLEKPTTETTYLIFQINPMSSFISYIKSLSFYNWAVKWRNAVLRKKSDNYNCKK